MIQAGCSRVTERRRMQMRNRLLLVTLVAVAVGLVAEASAAAQEAVPLASPVSGVKPVCYAEIEIEGPILETLPDLYLIKPDADTLYDLIERIKKAGTDDSVRGVVVKLDHVGGGWAKAQEIRRAMLNCRKAGKEVVCFMEGGGNLDYFVASAADRIVMVPSGSLLLVGLRAEVLFLKGLLDKIGVEADLIQIGSAKGAEEPLTRTTSSAPFRESINALLDDYYRQLMQGIAAGRKLTEEQVQDLVGRGPFTARQAKEAGLVDELVFYDELIRSLEQRHKGSFVLAKGYGQKPEKPTPLGTGPQELLKMVLGVGAAEPEDALPAGPTIAIVYAVGVIVSEDPDEVLLGESVVNVERISAILRKLRERDSVKAIVLRVDSPGGSADASDMIWHELRRTDEVKPVIVSLSDVAGSGGYYIATGGRMIYAEEGTITGSIGVLGGKLILKGLFEKLGLTVDVFERGAHAGMFSVVEEFSDSQRQRYRELLLETYEIFLDRIVTSRKQPLEDVVKLAEGQSLTGYQAQQGKLVDAIGGLDDAIGAAREAAKLPADVQVSIVRLPRPQSVIDVILWGKRELRMHNSLWQALPAEALPAIRYLSALRCIEDHRAAALIPALITVR